MFSESRMAGRRWRSRRVVARRERAVARLSRRMALEEQKEEQDGEQKEEQGGEQEERLLGRGGRSGTDTAKLLLDKDVG